MSEPIAQPTRPPGTPRYCPRCEYDLAVTEPDRPCPECAWVQDPGDRIHEIEPRGNRRSNMDTSGGTNVMLLTFGSVALAAAVTAILTIGSSLSVIPLAAAFNAVIFGFMVVYTLAVRRSRLRLDRNLLLICPEGVGQTNRMLEAEFGGVRMRHLYNAFGAVLIVLFSAYAWTQGLEFLSYSILGGAALGLLFITLPLEIASWRNSARPAANGLPHAWRWSIIRRFELTFLGEDRFRLLVRRRGFGSVADCEIRLDPAALQSFVQTVRTHSAAPITLNGHELPATP